MIELDAPPALIRQVRERDRVKEKQDVFYRVCSLCSFPTWASTEPNGEGRTVFRLDEEPCRGCASMHARHPEVVEWMNRVLIGRSMLRDVPQLPGFTVSAVQPSMQIITINQKV